MTEDRDHVAAPVIEEQSSDRMYVKYGGATFLVVLAIEVILLFRYAAAWASAVAGAVGLIAAVFGVYEDLRRPAIIRKWVTAGLVAELTVLLAVGGWKVYEGERSIEVTASFKMQDNIDVLPGKSATARLDIGESRARLVAVFSVRDHHPERGSCAPSTSLVVTLGTGGNKGVAHAVQAGNPAEFALASGAQQLHLDIRVRNDDDPNCSVDVSITSAELRN